MRHKGEAFLSRFAAMARGGSWLASLILLPLACLSCIYAAAVRVVKWRRKRDRSAAPCFSVTVGNLVVGGTGKTPLIIRLIEEIGSSSAIYMARGYGVSLGARAGIMISGRDAQYDRVGDEGALIGRRFPDIRMIFSGRLGKKRALRALDAGQEADWVLVDDALQHDEIAFDLKIAAIDISNPYGYGWLLPRGLLRETPASRLGDDVDYLVATHCSGGDEAHAWKERLEGEWGIPTIAVQTECISFVACDGHPDAPILVAGPILLASAIAKPNRFRQLVEQSLPGAAVVDHYIAGDHAELNIAELRGWIEDVASFSKPKALIITEKDWVRSGRWGELPLPVYFLKMGIKVLAGHDVWLDCITKIKNRERMRR